MTDVLAEIREAIWAFRNANNFHTVNKLSIAITPEIEERLSQLPEMQAGDLYLKLKLFSVREMFKTVYGLTPIWDAPELKVDWV